MATWAAWPSTGFGHGQQWCAKASALAQAPVMSKLDGSRGGGAKSNTNQRRANKGGTSAPRRISLIDARSITAMRQDQTRYGTTAIKVGNGPLNFAR